MERGLEGEEERKAISVFPPDHLKQIKELTETAETHLECQRFPLTEKETGGERERYRERGRVGDHVWAQAEGEMEFDRREN
ncbi:hypothetical protein QQF64_007756 [Cirrhinus molitorella]|uniref:Uncharacterized protein n=1 Tax=Cirrhinus molitorella TaxID=172907 RepID=A0ABR3MBP0_9TELE